MRLALGIGEGDIGHAERLLRHGEGRDLAGRKRRKAVGRGDSGPAGFGVRIASQMADPVYPGEQRQGRAQRQCRQHALAAGLAVGFGTGLTHH